MDTFEMDLNKFLEKTKIKASTAVAKITMEIFKDVVMATPVDTGRARANWMMAWNNADITTTVSFDPTGGKKQSEIQKFVMLNRPPLDKWNAFLTNSLDYIGKLEYGLYPVPSSTGKTKDGFSIQAPHGMVRITAVKWSEENIKRLLA